MHWSYVFLALTHQYACNEFFTAVLPEKEFHHENKIISPPFYLHNGSSFTSKDVFYIVAVCKTSGFSSQRDSNVEGITIWLSHHWHICQVLPSMHFEFLFTLQFIMSAMASTTSISIVCTAVCSDADQRKHQSSASLTFVRGIHQWSVNSPHKGPVTRKTFPFDDNIIFIVAITRLSFHKERIGMFWKNVENPLASQRPVTYFTNEINTLRPRQNGRHFSDNISNAFSWMNIFKFRLKFHWNLLFLRVQMTIFHHWFRWWLGTKPLSEPMMAYVAGVYMHHSASMGQDKLR